MRRLRVILIIRLFLPGSNVARITKIVSVKELMDEIVEDAIKELGIA